MRYAALTAVLAAASWVWWARAGGNLPLDPITFEDVTATSGVRFVARNSATPNKHQPETMLSGVAVFDYDNDGRLDLYFVNGARMPELDKAGPEYFNRLYRNNGDGTFTDVTLQAGVPGEGYGMGVATADYDNDGFTDLFLPGLNRNLLYRNRGDGTFEDVTRKAGLEGIHPERGKLWSIAAGWFDYDNDGWLDLFVVNYCVWKPEKEPFCGDLQAGYRTYCHPKYYEGLPNFLYRNNRDGTFTDVSETAGIARHIGKGMGVAFADYDQDGDLDVFVANDTVPNFLFRNDGGRFTEVAVRAGVAYNDDGQVLSSMGADFRDYDNDGREDLFITALANETFPLFRNEGRGFFFDATYSSRVGRASLPFSGWSNGIFDFNNDGWKDLFAANGDVQDNTELYSSRKARQRNLLLANLKDGTFEDVTAGAGPALQTAAWHRGAAFGDFDGDGRVDAIVTRLNEPAALLRNTSPAANHWLALRLRGHRSNRDGIGARVRVVAASGLEQWNHVTTSVGFACSSDRAVHFGLGKNRLAKLVEVRWPSGVVQRLENVTADRYLDLEEPR
ncbi:MAG: CRTAC1 family protein [Bryobacterales bacterium]|nr:CRTAC1 family protein [Bryobacterales bacterium]